MVSAPGNAYVTQRQTERQRDRETQTHRHTDTQVHTDTQTHRQTEAAHCGRSGLLPISDVSERQVRWALPAVHSVRRRCGRDIQVLHVP